MVTPCPTIPPMTSPLPTPPALDLSSSTVARVVRLANPTAGQARSVLNEVVRLVAENYQDSHMLRAALVGYLGLELRDLGIDTSADLPYPCENTRG